MSGTSDLPGGKDELNEEQDPYANLSIGVNPIVLHRRLVEYLRSATDDQKLSVRDHGIQHWVALSAANHGILNLETERRRDERTYTVKPYTVQTVPKDLRPAFTSPFLGEQIVELDWRTSHWQLIAFRSQDQQLIDDLRAGDIYTSVFPELPRNQVKAALAAILNGGGVLALTRIFGDEATAVQFQYRMKNMLKNRYAKAGAYIETLKERAVAEGVTTEAESYKGPGVLLMQMEAQALRHICSLPKIREVGLRVLLPMHDGILMSCAPDLADRAVEVMAKAMVLASTNSRQEAENNRSAWVKWSVSNSWGGEEPQLLGQFFRSTALKCVHAEDIASMILAAGAMRKEVESVKAVVAPASRESRLIKAAFNAHKEAQQWLREVRASKNNMAPLVQLPDNKPHYTNLLRILCEDVTFPRLAWNEKELCIELNGEYVDDTMMRTTFLPLLESRYGMTFIPETTLFAVCCDAARMNPHNPVKDWFLSLPPDDGNDVYDWVEKYLFPVNLVKTEASMKLLNTYGLKFMLSVVARTFTPGCKVDTVLILQGPQAARKSSVLARLAPAGSYQEMAVDPNNKDSIIRATKRAIVEWGELADAGKREQETLKAYFSQQEDTVRPPYARVDIRIPRQVVFTATTNEEDFLKDATGSRRYWPIKVGQRIDHLAIEALRDRLWAQALRIYREKVAAGEDHIWWLTDEEEIEREKQAEFFRTENTLVPSIKEFAEHHGWELTLDAVFAHLDIKKLEQPRYTKQIVNAMKEAGLAPLRKRREGNIRRLWVRKGMEDGE